MTSYQVRIFDDSGVEEVVGYQYQVRVHAWAAELTIDDARKFDYINRLHRLPASVSNERDRIRCRCQIVSGLVFRLDARLSAH